MRGIFGGTVVQVEPRSYEGNDGQTKHVADVYIASGDPRFGADRIEMFGDLAPEVGDTAHYLCNVTAKLSKAGREYLKVWAVKRLHVETADAALVTADEFTQRRAGRKAS